MRLRHIALNPACPVPRIPIYRNLLSACRSPDSSGIHRGGVCLLLSSNWVSRSPIHPTYGLENLGIVARIPGERIWISWRLTELGRTKGVDFTRGLMLPVFWYLRQKHQLQSQTDDIGNRVGLFSVTE